MTEDQKSELLRELNSKFTEQEPVKAHKIQKYSEVTKTLYSDEELAKKKVRQVVEVEVKKEDERSVDDMIKIFQERQGEEKKKPKRQGVLKLDTDKEHGWRSNH